MTFSSADPVADASFAMKMFDAEEVQQPHPGGDGQCANEGLQLHDRGRDGAALEASVPQLLRQGEKRKAVCFENALMASTTTSTSIALRVPLARP